MFELNRSFKVSEITQIIKTTLEDSLYNLQVEGEISNFRPSSTGHYYFTLKDKGAMISAVMFKNRSASLNFTPVDGQQVKVKGNISVYAQRGSYQIVVESIEKLGEGDILAKLEELKKKLASEGLFDEDKKKKIPILPSKIGIVSSPTGAALKDILRVLKQRNSSINLVVLPCPVQGDVAAPKIAEMIRTANKHKICDVLIIGRGGGSLEDLLPFSDEEVVRAVYDSEIPVISGVGHEIDYALSDFAADLRAPTPSAAAEAVSSRSDELTYKVSEYKNLFMDQMKSKIERVSLLLNQFKAENLERNFRILLQPYLIKLDDYKESLLVSLNNLVNTNKHKVELLKENLLNLSPVEILKKGYAIVSDENDNLIRSCNDVNPGENIAIRLFDGKINAEVKDKTNEEL